MEGKKIPSISFMTRVGDEPPNEDGGCPIGGDWVKVTTDDLFTGKRVLVFSLPGAFTPTCSTYQLPGFEEMYDGFKSKGIEDIYVSSVNDAFVMNAWAEKMSIKNVKTIPDGNGQFAEAMGMLVDMTEIGFGCRSRRFAAIINDGVVERMFVEPPATEEDPDPYGETSPETIYVALDNRMVG